MTPRRVLPYLLLFLVLAGTYTALKWHQESRQAQEQQAKKVFQVKEGEIGELALIRGKEEIRLTKTEKDWLLTKPLQTRADQETVGSMVTTLAHLQKERDLGAEQDLKSFGLDQPPLIVEFTAQGKTHRLLIGGKVPGDDKGYYSLKDQERNLLLISAGDKDVLDHPLSMLRDRSLLLSSPEKVKGLKIKTGNTAVQLEKLGPQKWRWVEREDLQVRGDRTEGLVRQLHTARLKDFVADSPKDLRTYGLAPQPQTEVVVLLDQGQEILLVGSQTAQGIYARKGQEGPVVLIGKDLAAQLANAPTFLEDRRLWAGPAGEAQKLVWGQPQNRWTAVKEKDSWKITGPQGQESRQSSARLDATLWKLTELEYKRFSPQATAPPKGGVYLVETYDGAGKLLFRLEEVGKKGETEVEVRAQRGDMMLTAWLSRENYGTFQGELVRLTGPPPQQKE
jgi:hypothetical protein